MDHCEYEMICFVFIKGMDIHLPAALMLNKPKQLFLRSKFGHVDVTCRPGKTTCRCKSHLQILSNTQNKSLDNQFKAPVGLNMDLQKLPNPLREPHFQAPRYMWRMQPTVSSFYWPAPANVGGSLGPAASTLYIRYVLCLQKTR